MNDISEFAGRINVVVARIEVALKGLQDDLLYFKQDQPCITAVEKGLLESVERRIAAATTSLEELDASFPSQTFQPYHKDTCNLPPTSFKKKLTNLLFSNTGRQH